MAIISVNTCVNSKFFMPNYVLSNAATLMNPHFERTMFTSKSFADFALKNTLSKSVAHRQIWADTIWLNILGYFESRVRCKAKFTQAFDANKQISKYPTCQTQYLGEIQHFQSKCSVNAVNFICYLLTGPLIKMIFEGRRTMLT